MPFPTDAIRSSSLGLDKDVIHGTEKASSGDLSHGMLDLSEI